MIYICVILPVTLDEAAQLLETGKVVNVLILNHNTVALAFSGLVFLVLCSFISKGAFARSGEMAVCAPAQTMKG